MKRASPQSLKLSFLLLFLGLAFVTTEYILANFLKKTLCLSSGCLIAEELLHFEKNSLLILAFIYYLVLVLILLFYKPTGGLVFRNLLFYLLTAGILADGYLILYLWFSAKVLCWFCLMIFFLTTASALAIFIYLRHETLSTAQVLLCLIFGIMAMAFMVYHSSPMPIISGEKSLEKEKEMLLIYSKRCPACQEVIAKAEAKGLSLQKVPLNRAYHLVHILGIKNLPSLIEFAGGQIVVYASLEEIKKRLALEDSQVSCEEKATSEGGLCVIP